MRVNCHYCRTACCIIASCVLWVLRAVRKGAACECVCSVVWVQCDRHLLVSTKPQACSLNDCLRATGGAVGKHQQSPHSYSTPGDSKINDHPRSVGGGTQCQTGAKAPLIPWVALAHVIARSVNPALEAYWAHIGPHVMLDLPTYPTIINARGLSHLLVPRSNKSSLLNQCNLNVTISLNDTRVSHNATLLGKAFQFETTVSEWKLSYLFLACFGREGRYGRATADRSFGTSLFRLHFTFHI